MSIASYNALFSDTPVNSGANTTSVTGNPQDANSATSLENEFISLMVAQIQNQDPLNPLDGTEYVSQLAQFSQVQSTENMASMMQNSMVLLDNMQVLSTAGLVGQTVYVSGNEFEMNDTAQGGKIELEHPSSQVTLVVTDEFGQAKKVPLGAKKADTKYGKNSSVGFATPSLGGKTIDELAASVDAQRGFDGSASSSQGNKLEGAITVTVHEVLPNGVLRISGEKWIRLNQGDEFIRLTGIVRVDDVSRNNQVSSARIGDARITYSGRGTLADSNAAGWLSQFFNSPWMPF